MSTNAYEIAQGLRQLGVPWGSVLALHSSLKSLGHVEGGAEAVIDAFQDALGPEGTLLVPTFTYTFCSDKGPEVFEPDKTPSQTGKVSEALRTRSSAARSLHPTHSVAALGAKAHELTANHLSCTPLGRNSPFHRVSLLDGWILLLGCGHEVNSFIHVAEVLAGVPYCRIFCWLHLGWQPSARFLAGDGQIRSLAIYECPGCSKAFPKIEPELRAKGAVKEGLVGAAKAQLLRAGDVLKVVLERLASDPAFLLCPVGDCKACDVRREAIGLPCQPPLPPPDTWIMENG